MSRYLLLLVLLVTTLTGAAALAYAQGEPPAQVQVSAAAAVYSGAEPQAPEEGSGAVSAGEEPQVTGESSAASAVYAGDQPQVTGEEPATNNGETQSSPGEASPAAAALIAAEAQVPEVVSSNPANGTTGIPRNTNIRITFKNAIVLTENALECIKICCWDGYSSCDIACNPAIASDQPNVLVLNNDQLKGNENITVTIYIGAVRDAASSQDLTQDVRIDFQTALEAGPRVVKTDPAPNTLDVPTDATIRITFDREIELPDYGSNTESYLEVTWADEPGWEEFTYQIDSDKRTLCLAPHEGDRFAEDKTLKVILKRGCVLDAGDGEEFEGSYSFTIDTNPDNCINFPDDNLFQALHQILQKPEKRHIYPDDLKGLTCLNLVDQNIHSLEGLEYASDLQELYITNNQVKDFSPLKGLAQLHRLDAGSNNLTDEDLAQSGIADLTGLTELFLYNNQLTGVDSLASLTGLQHLNLDGNQISDLQPLSGLTKLSSLSASSNNISDLSPLSALTGLTYLDLNGNQVGDLTPLSALSALEYLNLSQNQLEDQDCDPEAPVLAPLQELTNLQELDLNGNSITSIAPLVLNGGIGEGDTVYVGGNLLNPVSGSEDYNNCQSLLSRGVAMFNWHYQHPYSRPVSSTPVDREIGVEGGGEMILHFNRKIETVFDPEMLQVFVNGQSKVFTSRISQDNPNDLIISLEEQPPQGSVVTVIATWHYLDELPPCA